MARRTDPAGYGRLPTEQPNPAARRIDLKSASDILKIFEREDALVPRAVARERARIARAVEIVAKAMQLGGRLFFVGAGTSGRLGLLEAAECPPTFGTPPARIRAILAGGKAAAFRAVEGAEDDLAEGARMLRRAARAGDVVVGVAASGITPFVRGALKQARLRGCRTILVTANARVSPGTAEVVIAPRVGPELIAGSTRLKAATASKLALNRLTTAAMIRLGKVYDHWMVDLRPTSRKLEQRALRMICELGRVSPARARALLAQSGGQAKIAVLMARRGLAAPQARRRLRKSGDSLRRALEGDQRALRGAL